MTINNYHRQILALNDTELEQFVLAWISGKKIYAEVTRISGSGDLGRDVVGFLSKDRHGGDWHNYQCKQFGKTLPTADALNEIGKILYHAFCGEFSAPTKYFFIVPNGVNRNLEKLIFNPDKFKNQLISDWEKSCSKNIVYGVEIPLDEPLKRFIEGFDFSTISRITGDDILIDPEVKPILFEWFGADPGPAPCGQVPFEILNSELTYISQLVDAYSQRDGNVFNDYKEIVRHPTHGLHLSRQRERFYDADAFKRFYRDNTAQDILDTFEADILHGVIDMCDAVHLDALTRADAVMAQAATVQTSGPLAKHARVPVKQGVCHHFANDGRLKWRR